MKKSKDIAELASRLSSAATAPLVMASPAPPALAAEQPAPATREAGKRGQPNRTTVPVLLRLSQTLYEQCDREAVRRTKETGRAVTVQRIIRERLEGATA